MTQRDYLLDMAFVALLTGEDDLVTKIDAALRAPHWPLSLGRKSCIPTSPIAQGVYASEDKAKEKAKGFSKSPDRPFTKIIKEVAPGDGTERLMDVPVSFHHRTFSQREILIETP